MMNSVGAYLRGQRVKLSLSLNDVYEQTGITSTRLNRIELDQVNEPSPEVLKKLAELYQVDLIYLYKMAGYLDETDILPQIKPFKNYEVLSDEERNFIQQAIDILAKNHLSENREVIL